ncbi:MAG: hypothetical protein AB7K24_08675, partial [Gemmataceae bacterium]
PGAVAATAGRASPSVATSPGPRPGVTPPVQSAGSLLQVACPSRARQLRVKPELAGKAIKCPGCGKPVKVPAPTENDGWIDVGEAVEATAGAGATGDWGQTHLQKAEVPQDMQEQIRAELGLNEKIVWADRPRLEILLHRARKSRLAGIFMFLLSVTIFPGIGYFILQAGMNNEQGRTGAYVAVGVVGLMMLAFAAGSIFMIGSPGRVARNAAHRACYVLSNRRFLRHPGSGLQISFSRSGGSAIVNPNAGCDGITSFTGMELLKLQRLEERKFPGSGDLTLNRDLLERPAGGMIEAVGDVDRVEKLLRGTLIHPLVDKLLRGEISLKDHLGSKKEASDEEETETLPAEENNLKSYVGQLPTDAANVKQFKNAVAQDLNQVDADERARAEAELADGEKLLWVGVPEGKTKGRGLLGTLMGAAKRKEPQYLLYAITNRRALLWSERDTAVGGNLLFKDKTRGPFCYYPPQLLDVGMEEDARFPEGGNLLFKRVRVTIRTRTRDKRSGAVSVSVENELHCFGILRIRNMKAVARLLFDTLIRPCKTT